MRVQPPDFAGLRALVVDDNDFVRDVVVGLLRRIGLTDISIAVDGRDALERVRQDGRLDLVISDLQMPGVDGIELMRHFAETGLKAGIVFMSGVDRRLLQSAEHVARAHGLRVLGVMPKPASLATLRALVAQLASPASAIDVDDAESWLDAIGAEDIGRALEGGQVFVHFQPKVDVATKRFAAVEALARWRHPRLGMIPPAAFVPLAEQAGMADQLAERVLGESVEQLGRWRRDGLEIDMAVNLSVQALNRIDLPDLLRALAIKNGVDLARLTLEVTESGLVVDLARQLDTLVRLRMIGCKLSIDDFGTGYSTLQQLKRVPFTELKIDRLFVSGAAHDPDARAILEASVTLARRLELKVVAEGVETQEDWETAALAGCDLIQGFYVARPMPAEHLAPWVAAWGEGVRA